jgi:hypothetical protein
LRIRCHACSTHLIPLLRRYMHLWLPAYLCCCVVLSKACSSHFSQHAITTFVVIPSPVVLSSASCLCAASAACWHVRPAALVLHTCHHARWHVHGTSTDVPDTTIASCSTMPSARAPHQIDYVAAACNVLIPTSTAACASVKRTQRSSAPSRNFRCFPEFSRVFLPAHTCEANGNLGFSLQILPPKFSLQFTHHGVPPGAATAERCLPLPPPHESASVPITPSDLLINCHQALGFHTVLQYCHTEALAAS